MADELTMPALTGQSLIGAGGEPIWSSEIAYTPGTGNNGGPISRIVAARNASDSANRYFPADTPILRIKGYGNVIERLTLQGLWDPNDITKLSTNLNPALRADYGIIIEGWQSGLGTGKLRCPAGLTVMLCKTAIKCVDDPVADNADQNVINGRFFAPYCDTGWLLDNIQAVGDRIDYFDQLHCHTAFHVKKGGGLWCGHLVMQDGSARGLYLTGNDQQEISGDKRYFCMDRVEIDGGLLPYSDTRCVVIEPHEGFSSASVTIGFLQVDVGRERDNPLIVIDKSYGDINILGGTNFYNGMIKVTGGTSTHYPTIRIKNATFTVGNDPAKIFTTDSWGAVQYEYRDCAELANASSPVNEGKMFPNFVGVFNTAYNSPPIWGGYEPSGAVRTVTSNYTASLADDLIVVNNGSAAVITLPPAATIFGKEYTIVRIGAGSLSVQRSGTDTIDGLNSQPLSSANATITVKSLGGTSWKILRKYL